MAQKDFTSIVKQLRDLANQLDCENRKTGSLSAPTPHAPRLREAAVDLCLISSIKWTNRNGIQIIARLKRNSEVLESISRALVHTLYERKLRKIIFDLINQTPEVLKAIIESLPASSCLCCDRKDTGSFN